MGFWPETCAINEKADRFLARKAPSGFRIFRLSRGFGSGVGYVVEIVGGMFGVLA
jgi:hypothetical protein